MIIIEYKIACKSCLKTDGIIDIMRLNTDIQFFFENRLLKSEYALGKHLKSLLQENNLPCQFCGSNNLDIRDISIEGKKALISNESDQMQLVLSKHESGDIEIKTQGSKYLPKDFMPIAFDLIQQAIQETHDSEFEEKHIGFVSFVVSTGYIGNDDYRTYRLEQFSFVGFNKVELGDLVGQMKNQMLKPN